MKKVHLFLGWVGSLIAITTGAYVAGGRIPAGIVFAVWTALSTLLFGLIFYLEGGKLN